MQAQDAATAYFFKLWEWLENNIRTVIIGAGVVAIVIALVSYYFWRQGQMEVIAGQELTQLLVSTPPNSDAGQLANAYFKIAADYPDTQSGKRALVLAAVTLFESSKYAEAQTQFQKYLDANPASTFSATAALGVAASLEAQGKTDAAANAYQQVISSYSDPNAVAAAQFALAKMNEQQGKLVQAENLYQEVAHHNPNTSLGSEAAFQAFQVRSKASATMSTNASATSVAPFSLSTKP
jgi:predicted negative regulator of RcsB-dependent stress response